MNPIKPTIKTEIISIIFLIIAIASSFYFFVNFPERVPIHWNIAGEPDGWGSPMTAAFLFPVIIFGMYLMFLAIPYLDPKKKRYEQFAKIYHIFKTAFIVLMTLMYFVTSFNALGANISINFWIPLLVGVLFIIIGNYMAKIKPNWFMGIRTPWTLSSEEVWNKTHRLGGKLFIISGIIMILLYFFPESIKIPLLLGNILALVIVTIGYSYYLFVKESKKK